MGVSRRVGIGIIGCGNISSQYLKAMQDLPVLEIIAIADMQPEVAEKKAAEFGLTAVSVEALLADPKVEIILNLTIPRAHVEVGLRAIAAGKHVYGEKPLGITYAEGKKLIDAAKAKAACASARRPTPSSGAGTSRRARWSIAGAVGDVVGGTAFMGGPGHERWHPDPAFYYDIGGGPMLDMGPYYITDLVNLPRPGEERAGDERRRRRPSGRSTRSPRRARPMPVKVFDPRGGAVEVQIRRHHPDDD